MFTAPESRTRQLLEAMAHRLDHNIPVDGGFLQEHNVSFDELGFLGIAATVLRGYLASPASEQARLYLRGMGLPAHLVEIAYADLRTKEINAQGKLQDLTEKLQAEAGGE